MINVIVVDDHKIFMDGFKMVIESIKDVKLIGQAFNGKEFIDLIKKKKADVVFMDINMPVMNGVNATKEALKYQPDMKIIALTAYGDIDYINKMLMAGVEGYMLKDADYEEVEEAIHSVMAGKNYFSKEVLVTLTKNSLAERDNKKRKKEFPHLSGREMEVLQLMCKGFSKKEIAQKLFISERTVEKHKENLMQKTNTKSSVNLVIYAIKNKIVKL